MIHIARIITIGSFATMASLALAAHSVAGSPAAGGDQNLPGTPPRPRPAVGIGHVETSATEPCTVLTSSPQPVLALSMNVPRAGLVVLTASGFYNIGHIGGPGLDDGFVCLSTEPSPPQPDCPGIAEFGFPSSLPAGTYRVPFSVTRTFPAERGATTWYLTGVKAGDPGNSVEVCQPQVSGIFATVDLTF